MSGFGLGFGFAYVRSILSRVAATEIFTANVADFNVAGQPVMTATPRTPFDITDVVSLSVWVNVQADATGGSLVAQVMGTIGNTVLEESYGFQYNGNNGNMGFTGKNTSNNYVSVFSPMVKNQLFHFVGVIDSVTDQEIRIYKDRVLIDTVPFTTAINIADVGNPFNIGGTGSTTRYGLNGLILTPSVFTGVVTQEEMDSQVDDLGNPRCFELWADSLKAKCIYSPPLENHTGTVGQELINKGTATIATSNTEGILFNGAVDIECEEYVPSVNDMLMTVDTTQAGSASDTFIFPLTSMGGLASIQIAWGDGSSSVITAVGQAELTHVYAVGGVKNLTVIGAVGYEFSFNGGGDRLKLKSLENYGNTKLTSAQFLNCTNFDTITATDLPLSAVNVLLNTFRGTGLSSIPRIGEFPITAVTNMQTMFFGSTSLDIDISGWSIPSVTTMASILTNTSFSTANYDLLIESWHDGVSVTGKQPVTGCAVGVGTTQYSSAVQAKYDALVTYGIVFTDGGVV